MLFPHLRIYRHLLSAALMLLVFQLNPQPSALGTTSKTHTKAPSDWIAYTNPEQGYTLTYPESWSLEVRDGVGPMEGYAQIYLGEQPSHQLSLSTGESGGSFPFLLLTFEGSDPNTNQYDPLSFAAHAIGWPVYTPTGRVHTFGTTRGYELGSGMGYLWILPSGRNYFSAFVTDDLTPDLTAILESLVFTHFDALPLTTTDRSLLTHRLSQITLETPAAISAQAPTMHFPWAADEPQILTSGPHGNNDTHYTSCNPTDVGVLSGLDFGLKENTDVLAAAPGTIIDASTHSGIGLVVTIAHSGGWYTGYWHLNSIDPWVVQNLNVANAVRQGQLIGKSGDGDSGTNHPFSYHLHFELRSGTASTAARWDGTQLENYIVHSTRDATNLSNGLNYRGTLTTAGQPTSLAAAANEDCGTPQRSGRQTRTDVQNNEVKTVVQYDGQSLTSQNVRGSVTAYSVTNFGGTGAGFTGNYASFTSSDPNLGDNLGQNPAGIGSDMIASLRVPRDWVVILYDAVNYGGNAREYSGDINDLGDFKNRARSLKVGYLFCPAGVFESIQLACQPTTDTTTPSGAFTSPSNGATINSSIVTVSATASDNAGGSGVREVRFSAKWSGSWHGIGTVYATPYTLQWDLCAAGVPQGSVELGLEVWDNANNKWVYSEHATNPQFTAQHSCGSAPSPTDWSIEYWTNSFLAGGVNARGADSAVYLFKDWAGGSPMSGIGGTDWSARYSTTRTFSGGLYHFHADADDGVRLYVDGSPADPAWWTNLNRDLPLSAGPHTIVVEYRQIGGNSKMQVWWRGPGALPATTRDNTQWFAQYYPNRDFWGDTPLELNEGGGFLNKQWGSDGPGWGFPVDSFSARFRRYVDFACGDYQFDVFGDDGVRIKLDGRIVSGLDQWHDAATWYSARVAIPTGLHEVELEYFEHQGGASAQLTWTLINGCRPDLKPFPRPDYSAPVTPSSVQGMTSANTLYADARTFLNWSFQNAGGSVGQDFGVELWVDDQRLLRYPFAGLGDGQIQGFTDWAETIVQPGWHTLKMVVDPENAVAETDESNNTWQGQFYWQPINGWRGEYFANGTLAGNPWGTLDEPYLKLDWGSGAPPLPSFPSDNFSARWTRSVSLAAGNYRFHMSHDDGARLYVDGNLIVDTWATCCTWETGDTWLSSGSHLEVDPIVKTQKQAWLRCDSDASSHPVQTGSLRAG